ncbi:ADP-ribosyl cyclase/cyclic ADP-ribose hydrolase 1-like [Betta splendens]|uniref:ADP-ribosyl cyclase/cyclic ADP-ribose hydrolase n=1 Tax=Betta splendens TaxID=158456 RepID=A0A6P7MC83_BETSP|nr:ADP-ribosyl cyclase/cyclic ADP-ribose hydrolase 1-like [Betta splendens]
MKGIWIGVIVGVSVAAVIMVAGLSFGLTMGKKGFISTFMTNCGKHKGANCPKIWEAFSQAYVGKNSCEVPMEAYDSLIQRAPIEPMHSTALLWSKTDGFQQRYKTNTKSLVLGDTLLGSLLGNETWCGKEGSEETITSGCPSWGENDCENNPVRSFWKRASAAFADAARGDVTALLNADIDDPFSPTSMFRSIEIKRLRHPMVESMKVVLVTKNYPGNNCEKPFLEDLRRELDTQITYSCTEVSNGHKCLASLLVYLLLIGQFFL